MVMIQGRVSPWFSGSLLFGLFIHFSAFCEPVPRFDSGNFSYFRFASMTMTFYLSSISLTPTTIMTSLMFF
jgi:hypothetical protein